MHSLADAQHVRLPCERNAGPEPKPFDDLIGPVVGLTAWSAAERRAGDLCPLKTNEAWQHYSLHGRAVAYLPVNPSRESGVPYSDAIVRIDGKRQVTRAPAVEYLQPLQLTLGRWSEDYVVPCSGDTDIKQPGVLLRALRAGLLVPAGS